MLLLALSTSAQVLQPDSMRREITLLQTALTTLHPGIYRYQTPEAANAVFKHYRNLVSRPITKDHYFILISQLLTHLHCGHTYTNYWNQPKSLQKQLYSDSRLPLLFRMLGKQMIVTHNLSNAPQIKAGDEILAINGIPVKRIVDSLLTVSPSDGLHGLTRKLDNISIEPLDVDTANYNLFDIYFPLFFPKNFNTDFYQLTIQHKKVSVAAITKKERLAIYSDRFGVLPVHEKNWSLNFVKRSAVFKIGDFETWEWKADYHHYLDSIFKVIKARRISNLIVDIRGNGGGDDAARDEVFSYLTGKPFGCEDPMHRRFRFLSIPDNLLPYLQTWDKTFKQAKNAGDYVQYPDGLYESKKELNSRCEPISPKADHFNGNVWLLTDSRNESTTFTLAKMFRIENVGQIVGETTSGNQQGINGGQFFFLNLPYSHIEADIPLVWGAYKGNRPDTGIKPDILIPVTQASIASQKDAALDYVLKK